MSKANKIGRHDLFSLFVDYFNLPIIVLSEQFAILEINDASLNLFNWDKNKILNQNIYKLCETCSIEPPISSNFCLSNNLAVLSDWKSIIKIDGEARIIHWNIKHLLAQKRILLTGYEITSHLTHVDSKNFNSLVKKSMINLIFEVVRKKLSQPLQEATVSQALKNFRGMVDDIVEDIPGQVYWTDRHGIYLGYNQYVSELYGLASRTDLIGRTAHFIQQIMQPRWQVNIADNWEATSKEVMLTKQPLLYYRDLSFGQKINKAIITKPVTNKIPIINRYGEVLGVFGITIDENDSRQLRDLIGVYTTISHVEDRSLENVITKREYACLACAAHGKTVKAIAAELKISPRTVETYINNIKAKLECYSKTQIIEKYWESQGFE